MISQWTTVYLSRCTRRKWLCWQWNRWTGLSHWLHNPGNEYNQWGNLSGNGVDRNRPPWQVSTSRTSCRNSLRNHRGNDSHRFIAASFMEAGYAFERPSRVWAFREIHPASFLECGIWKSITFTISHTICNRRNRRHHTLHKIIFTNLHSTKLGDCESSFYPFPFVAREPVVQGDYFTIPKPCVCALWRKWSNFVMTSWNGRTQQNITFTVDLQKV